MTANEPGFHFGSDENVPKTFVNMFGVRQAKVLILIFCLWLDW